MNELARPQKCVVMRNGIEIWVDEEKADRLQATLQGITSSKFVLFEGQTFNTADVLGIFTPGTMSDHTRRKNGAWKCKQGEWHDKAEKCFCRTPEETARWNQIKRETMEKFGIEPLP